MSNSPMKQSSHLLFFELCLSYCLILFATQLFLVNDDLYFNSLSDKLSYERILEILTERQKWSWLNYVIVPVFFFLKLFLISICFTVGAFVVNLKLSFKVFFRVAIIAEFVFVAPPLIKLFWFVLFRTNYGFEDLQYFSPLSIISLIGAKEVESWLVYPLQLLNIFELLYWFALAHQLKIVIGRGMSGSLVFVAGTYGAGLLIWVVVVMFLLISIT